ncbi:MAG: hypothetical protein MZU79_04315 [Anaerotruncus sp.]|nr:hypothetical protein [Anaerotruncus sp.]
MRPIPITIPPGVRMGGYQQAGARRHFPREVPERASRGPSRSSRDGLPRSLSSCRTCPTRLPQGTPDHGPGPELLVPLVRPESPDVRRHPHGRRDRLPEGHASRLSYGPVSIGDHVRGSGEVTGGKGTDPHPQLIQPTRDAAVCPQSGRRRPYEGEAAGRDDAWKESWFRVNSFYGMPVSLPGRKMARILQPSGHQSGYRHEDPRA